MFLSKIVISKHHVYTCKCGGKPYHIMKSSKMELSGWNCPVINEPKCCFFFLFFLALDNFFQLLCELCFPTWLFAFSKICFKLKNQVSM